MKITINCKKIFVFDFSNKKLYDIIKFVINETVYTFMINKPYGGKYVENQPYHGAV